MNKRTSQIKAIRRYGKTEEENSEMKGEKQETYHDEKGKRYTTELKLKKNKSIPPFLPMLDVISKKEIAKNPRKYTNLI